MTEAQWLAGPELGFLAEEAARSGSLRKMRLLAAACCRRVWHLLRDERSRIAIEVAERYAEGRAGPGEREDAFAGASRANDALVDLKYDQPPGTDPGIEAALRAAQAACAVAS